MQHLMLRVLEIVFSEIYSVRGNKHFCKYSDMNLLYKFLSHF